MIVYLFYLLIALFPLGVVARITFFSFITISVQDLVVFAILLFSTPQIIAIFAKKNKFVMLYGLFAVVSLLGLAIHTKTIFEFLASASYLVRLTSYVMLVIPLLQMRTKVQSRLKVELLCTGMIFILFGYVQYIYYPSLRNLFYLGWDEHLYRLFSTLLDPNFAGIYILLIIILYSTFFFTLFKKAVIAWKAVLVLGYVFLAPALLLTYSRDTYVAAVVSLIVFLLLIRQTKTVAIFLALFILGIFLLPKGLGGEGVKLLRTASIISRLDMYKNAWTIFTDNIFIGVGFDSLRFVSRSYGFLSERDYLVSHSAAGVPNAYLSVLVTSGVIGFVLFFGFILNILKKILALTGQKKNVLYSAGVFASFTAVLTASLFENSLLYAPIMLWLAVITGLLFNGVRSARADK